MAEEHLISVLKEIKQELENQNIYTKYSEEQLSLTIHRKIDRTPQQTFEDTISPEYRREVSILKIGVDSDKLCVQWWYAPRYKNRRSYHKCTTHVSIQKLVRRIAEYVECDYQTIVSSERKALRKKELDENIIPKILSPLPGEDLYTYSRKLCIDSSAIKLLALSYGKNNIKRIHAQVDGNFTEEQVTKIINLLREFKKEVN